MSDSLYKAVADGDCVRLVPNENVTEYAMNTVDAETARCHAEWINIAIRTSAESVTNFWGVTDEARQHADRQFKRITELNEKLNELKGEYEKLREYNIKLIGERDTALAREKSLAADREAAAENVSRLKDQIETLTNILGDKKVTINNLLASNRRLMTATDADSREQMVRDANGRADQLQTLVNAQAMKVCQVLDGQRMLLDKIRDAEKPT